MRHSGFFFAAILMILSGLAGAVEPAIHVAVEERGDAFILDTEITFPAPVSTAWAVLTDFDNMTATLTNLTTSKVTGRNGETVQVRQAGRAKFGLFSYAFESEREIRLEPMKRIQARQISGNARQFASDLELTAAGDTTQAHYHAEVIPDSSLARIFGASFIKHEVEEQFTAMAAEMSRRNASAP